MLKCILNNLKALVTLIGTVGYMEKDGCSFDVMEKMP